jgi:hypothetical protein
MREVKLKPISPVITSPIEVVRQHLDVVLRRKHDPQARARAKEIRALLVKS